MAEFVYVSVIISNGPQKLLKKLHRADTKLTCGELFEEVWSGANIDKNYRVTRVCGGLNETTPTSELSVFATPVHIVRAFGLACLRFSVSLEEETKAPKESAFSKLYSAQAQLVYPANKKDKTKADTRLYNDLIDCVRGLGIGWTQTNVEDVGEKVISKLSQALWYLNTHHDKLATRGCAIPSLFTPFRDYYDYKSAHQKAPIVSKYCNKMLICIAVT
jgi:hypothetical protein